MIGHVDAVRLMREQRMTRPKSRFDPVVAFNDQVFFYRQALEFQSIAESLPSSNGIAYSQRTADQTYPLAARSSEMAHRVIGTLIVIGEDGILGKFRISSHHENKGNIYLPDHLLQGRAKISSRFGQ